MDCVRCKASNPDDKKFCGDCGMPLDPALSQLSEIVDHAVERQVQAVLDSRLKDSQVVQVETAEAIEERLTNWAKFYVGIPAAILAVVLGLFGISKFADFANLIEAKKADLGKALQERQGQIDAIKSKGEALDRQYTDLESRLPRYKSLDQKLEQLGQQQTVLAKKVEQVERLAFKPSAALTPELKGKLESTLLAFRSYFQQLGFRPSSGNITVSLQPTIAGAISYYDPGPRIMFVNPHYANDLDMVYREYTNHVLVSSNKAQYGPADFNWIGIESALAAYFPCSFSGKPTFGELSARLHPEFKSWNLENNRSFSEDTASDYASAMLNGTAVWGGAFWEIRRSLGQAQADKLLLSAWIAVPPDDFHRNAPHIFVDKLLEIVRAGGEARANEIRAIFARRGLKV